MKRPPRRSKFWAGPYSDAPNGGITQSLLQKFIICRHRFWLQAVCGYDPEPEFDHKMEFGSIFHAGVEQLGSWDSLTYGLKLQNADKGMRAYCNRIKQLWPTDASDIDKQRMLADYTFRRWFKYWHKSRLDVVEREHVCGYWHCLPDGREIWVKGKIDGIIKHNGSLLLHEIKTKGLVDMDQIMQSLKYDLQIHVYANYCHAAGYPVKGVLYDVIRRPLGSRSAPQIRKGESWRDFIKRCFETYDGAVVGYPIDKHLDHWFIRHKHSITADGLQMFNERILDPWLTQLADWWDSISSRPEKPWISPLHNMRPFGVWDNLNQGYNSDFYGYLTMGIKPERQRTLFPELEQ